MFDKAGETVSRGAQDGAAKLLVGIDIGGTKVAVATAEIGGRIVAKRKMPTEVEKGPQYTIQKIIALVRQVLDDSGAARPIAVGVGCGGPLDPDEGVILSPPNLPGWDAIPLRQILEDEFRTYVYIDNDANAAALGEYRFGAGVEASNLVYITVSTGIGGGIIVNGRLLQGIRASAGEIGHQTILRDGVRCKCGNRGCLEALASGTAIARRAREALASRPNGRMMAIAGGDLQKVTTETVVQAVREGDSVALEIWNETIEYLSIGVANVITTLAPDMVVIGGGVTEAGDLLYAPLRQAVGKRVFLVPLDRVKIVSPKLGTDVGVVGAIAVALQHLEGKG
ncbi:MAG: ROK family protein [Chloroflexi bacterium]|nr:ROK family protein [Chloroflexota bacterium]